MAGIDKIYLSEKQYHEFYEWCQDHSETIEYQTDKKVMNYFYDFDDIEPMGGEYASTNFPEVIDKWLMVYCPLDYIQNRLLEQYDKKTIERARKKVKRKPKGVNK